MLKAVNGPRAEVSRYAPAMEMIRIPSDRIGYLIGPGGKNIKGLQETYKVKISILSDDGEVSVSGLDRAKVNQCLDIIRAMTETPQVGARYKGMVKSTKDFGAFVEILPAGRHGPHLRARRGYVSHVEDVVQVGTRSGGRDP
jgi:polyribonucleotide nucleotidyltransferase